MVHIPYNNQFSSPDEAVKFFKQFRSQTKLLQIAEHYIIIGDSEIQLELEIDRSTGQPIYSYLTDYIPSIN